MVRAPVAVCSVCTTVSLSGASSCATVTVPVLHDENAYPVPGSNQVASTPPPIGTSATILPLVESIISILLLWAPMKRRCVLRSIASPAADSPGAIGHFATTSCFATSMTTISLPVSLFT